VKNKLSLFERSLKMKDGVFVFVISSLVPEILKLKGDEQ